MGVFRSGVALSDDQVHTEHGSSDESRDELRELGTQIAGWVMLKILEVVQNLETKEKMTIEGSVFHEGGGVTESSADEVMRRGRQMTRDSSEEELLVTRLDTAVSPK